MPINNDQVSPLPVSGIGHRRTNIWFRPNGAANPTSFGGPHVTSVVRTATGIDLITLSDFMPFALISCSAWGYNGVNVTHNAHCRVGAVVINAAARTVTLTALTSQATGAGKALVDLSTHPNTAFKISAWWKMTPARDHTGL